MTAITLGIGSNVDARKHVNSALDALQAQFGELTISSVFESEAVGFNGDNFLNLVVRTETEQPLARLIGLFRHLEEANGRQRSQTGLNSRTLDVDILTYGDLQGEHEGIVLPRPEITRNAYVLWPLAQVWGEGIDPASQQSYARLWEAYDKREQHLWPVDFCWQGRKISSALPADPGQG